MSYQQAENLIVFGLQLSKPIAAKHIFAESALYVIYNVIDQKWPRSFKC